MDLCRVIYGDGAIAISYDPNQVGLRGILRFGGGFREGKIMRFFWLTAFFCFLEVTLKVIGGWMFLKFPPISAQF